MKRKISIEEEKKIANEGWDRYLASLTKENYDRDVMVFMMEKMNIIDYRLIEEKKHHLLG